MPKYSVQIEDRGKNPAGDWVFETNEADFTGSGFYRWNGPNYYNKNQAGKGTLRYTVDIEEAGTYFFAARSLRDAGVAWDQNNDFWLRVPGVMNQWEKIYFGGRQNFDKWAWAVNIDTGHGKQHPLVKLQLDEGPVTFEISGRSKGYHIDGFTVNKGSVSRTLGQGSDDTGSSGGGGSGSGGSGSGGSGSGGSGSGGSGSGGSGSGGSGSGGSQTIQAGGAATTYNADGGAKTYVFDAKGDSDRADPDLIRNFGADDDLELKGPLSWDSIVFNPDALSDGKLLVRTWGEGTEGVITQLNLDGWSGGDFELEINAEQDVVLDALGVSGGGGGGGTSGGGGKTVQADGVARTYTATSQAETFVFDKISDSTEAKKDVINNFNGADEIDISALGVNRIERNANDLDDGEVLVRSWGQGEGEFTRLQIGGFTSEDFMLDVYASLNTVVNNLEL